MKHTATSTTQFSHTKEFYDLRAAFERANAVKLCHIGRLDWEKGEEWNNRGSYYEDGEVNSMFHAYMEGYALAKAMAQQGEWA